MIDVRRLKHGPVMQGRSPFARAVLVACGVVACGVAVSGLTACGASSTRSTEATEAPMVDESPPCTIYGADVAAVCGCPSPVEARLQDQLPRLEIPDLAIIVVNECLQPHLGTQLADRRIASAEVHACIVRARQLDPLIPHELHDVIDAADRDLAEEQAAWVECYRGMVVDP